ncbi:hypothetical protein QBC45DRAFT_230094 [Copromyces sp. CBS 386.78]|nr:hypothetical protein QBC45DRAFT_230094 [Copromyces sp. CBS 386.78]
MLKHPSNILATTKYQKKYPGVFTVKKSQHRASNGPGTPLHTRTWHPSTNYLTWHTSVSYPYNTGQYEAAVGCPGKTLRLSLQILSEFRLLTTLSSSGLQAKPRELLPLFRLVFSLAGIFFPGLFLPFSTIEAIRRLQYISISDISPGSGSAQTCRAVAIDVGSRSLPSVGRIQPLSISLVVPPVREDEYCRTSSIHHQHYKL